MSIWYTRVFHLAIIMNTLQTITTSDIMQQRRNSLKQMDFLTPELYRILKPGRVAAIHVKRDRVLFGNATGTGTPTIEPFHV